MKHGFVVFLEKRQYLRVTIRLLEYIWPWQRVPTFPIGKKISPGGGGGEELQIQTRNLWIMTQFTTNKFFMIITNMC